VRETLDATDTAKARYDKIYSTLSAFRLSESPDIKKLLSDSDTLIRESGELNTKAHDLILNTDYVFQLSTSTATTTPSATSTSAEPTSTATSTPGASSTSPTASSTATSTPPQSDDVSSLIKASLGKIKDTYTNYLAVSKLVKKIIGF
jgi:hypothetical protein